MIKNNTLEKRNLHHIQQYAELIVTGGGMSGICTAITAARQGLHVILIHDRPVLGGNASSEVRLWMLGATSHMGNNNRWSREGGVIDEILVENTYRNPQGNPIILDMILIDKVKQEKNIQLFLNTAVYSIEKSTEEHMGAVWIPYTIPKLSNGNCGRLSMAYGTISKTQAIFRKPRHSPWNG